LPANNAPSTIRHITSFRDFLSTGRPGPISPDLDLRDVADHLGTPQGWLFTDDAPHYWIYSEAGNDGPTLEIQFSATKPHPVHWFQIEDAGCIRGDVHLFGASLAMTTDGLSGASKPSDFLRSGAFSSVTTELHLGNDLELTITTDRIAVFFSGTKPREGRVPADKQVIYRDLGGRLDFTDRDRAYRLGCIYSFHTVAAARRSADALLTRATCSVQQYLSMLR